uniref:von Willebrand factor C and EGF domain-containing protein n=1 Tax=Leptobrachium leishanense TaxID=445787 RepID=A0A8C5Q8E1_9ANUR
MRIMVPFWMGVSCLLLLVSGREGHAYNGRKKPPTLTAQRLRSGPHTCYSGMGSGCCPGWTISPGSGQCLQAICSYGCGSGFCVAPNVCSCRDGHQGVTCTDDFASEHDKDLEGKGLSSSCLSVRCDQGCRLVSGVPVCTCFHGFTLGKDGKTCYDVDECSRPQASNLCHQQCKNSIGSYRCLCYYGFQISLNGRICIPNKHPNNIAAPSPCGEYGCELKCNDGGCEHISRVCPLGFRMTETANGVACTDINECATSSCEGTCINTEGGFMCDCGLGLKLSADGSICYDIDECSAHWSPCQQRCKNLHGSYRCYCGAGFVLHSNGHTCTDVDECAVNTTLCFSGYCLNTVGSYLCSCPLGFRPTDGGCSEIHPEVQSSIMPLGTEAARIDWVKPKPTLTASFTPGPPEITRNQTALVTLAQELVNTRPTSETHNVMTDLDPLPPPQHLRTGHSSQGQKSSGISPMSLKEDMIIQHGTSSPQHVDVPCWHNMEMKVNGSTWTEPGCIDCTCQEGTVSCARRTCHTNCSHPILHPDSCCPSCDGCQFEGTSRAEGELFPYSPDNCTVCVCLTGNVTCIPPACPPVTCTDPYMSDCCLRCPDGCEFQGRVYPHGAKFSQDESGCTSCLCQNGTLECSFVPCPSLKCPREDWILEVGQCCFKCQEPPQSTGCPFDDNGIEIPVGQIWSPGDPCAICICQADGSIECKKTDCVETCPHPITVPGQCCPDCSAGCSYGRRTYRNNESFLSTTDPCLTCICLVGTVACSPIECALNCTYPFHDEGECCPLCRDCTYDGRKVLNGQTFSMESDPCTQCTCQHGEVECEAVICPFSCSHPYVFPGECCSACEECVIEGHVVENGGSFIEKLEPCVICLCSGGNLQCEPREGPCTPCEQDTQDCINAEVPDPFQTKELHHSHLGTSPQESNKPIKLMNSANPGQGRRQSLFQKIILRTEAVTAPNSHLPTHKAELSFDSLSVTPKPQISHMNRFVRPFRGTLSSMPPKTHKEAATPYTQAFKLSNKKVSSDPSYNSFNTSASIKVPDYSAASTFLTNLPLKATTAQPYNQVSHIVPQPISQMTSHPKVVDTGFPHPNSPSTTRPSGLTTTSMSTSAIAHISEPSLVRVPVSHNSQAQKSVPATSRQGTDISSQSVTPKIVLASKYNSDPTNIPAMQIAHTTRSTGAFRLTKPATFRKDGDIISQVTDHGHFTGCYLKGHTFVRGSIFIVDVDFCLQCECLDGEVYCRPESFFPTGLCCQDCLHPSIISCSRETNQIHSEEGENQAFCRCRNVTLQCHSCTPKQGGCNSEGAARRTESGEQGDQNYIHWIPLIFGDGENIHDMNPIP